MTHPYPSFISKLVPYEILPFSVEKEMLYVYLVRSYLYVDFFFNSIKK